MYNLAKLYLRQKSKFDNIVKNTPSSRLSALAPGPATRPDPRFRAPASLLLSGGHEHPYLPH